MQAADETKTGKSIRRQDLPVTENVYGGMTKEELSQAQEKELQLVQQDIKVEQTKDKKNLLESYVYETRNKVLPESVDVSVLMNSPYVQQPGT